MVVNAVTSYLRVIIIHTMVFWCKYDSVLYAKCYMGLDRLRLMDCNRANA